MIAVRMARSCAVALVFLGCSSNEPTKTGDTTPPATVQDLALLRLPGRDVRLTWTAPGNDGNFGRASAYEIRYASSPLTEQRWDSCSVLPSPVPAAPGQIERIVASLPDGIWHLGIRTADDVPNWSYISNQVTITMIDTIPPAAVTDLSMTVTTGHSVALSWEAPGNDGSRGRATTYDFRFSPDSITTATWEAAVRVEGVPAPGEAGSQETCTVEGLTTGERYYLALKTSDETPNWSALSNVEGVTIFDRVAPAAVMDLAARAAGDREVKLTWTAPGNDGNEGTAAVYDVRFATVPLTEETWDSALMIQDVSEPSTGSSPESLIVTGLDRWKLYYFGVKTGDEVSNWSPLSNVATAIPSEGGLTRLTYSPPPLSAYSPSWSPDGRQIAFTANWEPRPNSQRDQIYLMLVQGGPAVQLTQLPEGAFAPAWSPDGTRIAFVALIDDYPYTVQELSLMEARPDAARTVLRTARRVESIGRPAWSPDGTQIAYVTTTWDYPNPNTSVISIIPATGGASRILIAELEMWTPSWSPNGTQVLFAGDRDGNIDIWMVPAAGGEAVQLTNDPAIDSAPAWSPDGNRIAFVSQRSGNSEIWLMSSIGENPTQLTFSQDGEEYAPSWSPDGGSLCFELWKESAADVWTMQVP